MTIIKKLLLVYFISLFVLIAFGNPNKGNLKNSSPIFILPTLPSTSTSNGPPPHAKAWGRRNNWKNMNKAQRKALKHQQDNLTVADHAKAIGRALLN